MSFVKISVLNLSQNNLIEISDLEHLRDICDHCRNLRRHSTDK